MRKEYKVLLSLGHLINEESPRGRTEGLNQQMPNLGSRCLGNLCIYSAFVLFVTELHKRSYKRGKSSTKRVSYQRGKEESVLLSLLASQMFL